MTERIEITQDQWGYFEAPSYDLIVESFGDILVSEEYGNYEGDSLYLIWNDTQGYGILTFGWGSCSGCDAREAVDNQEDLNQLQDDLERNIKWFSTTDEVKEYILEGGLNSSYLATELVFNFGKKIIDWENN